MSNPIIHNLILSRKPTPPTKHPHLRYTHFVYVLVLHRPTFCAIQRRQPYCLAYDGHTTHWMHSSTSSILDKDRRANTRCTWFSKIGYVYGVKEFLLIVKGLHKYIGSSSLLVGTSECFSTNGIRKYFGRMISFYRREFLALF
ncbi:hypothetical protein DVH24_007775 [Malus domestica]|uniref:Uncharacterized protein n=1 Tax=Malus domestica TaxID=3750 RepID=A0A498JN97_MALDO|nr:hypothetical protein DVH24_007775 [Malus domestica]